MINQKPLLKIGPLSVLQDARYSAAVGFDIITYCLARGSDHKLSAATAWNLVQWLSGPESSLELNGDSFDEIAEATALFPVSWIEFPWEDRNTPWPATSQVIAHCPDQTDPAALHAWLEANEQHYFQVKISDIQDINPYSGWSHRLFIQFDRTETAITWLSTTLVMPFGIAFSAEWEDAPGEMNYAAIDEALELLEARMQA